MVSTEFYQQRAQHFQLAATQTEGVIRKHAWSRLIIAVLALVCIYFGFTDKLFFYPVPLLVILFFYLVKKQQRLEEQKQLLDNLVSLNDKEEKALTHQFDSFPNGERYIDPHHPFSHDLDLFGNGSLFQYLNRSATQSGEDRLAQDLTSLLHDKDEVIKRQHAIRELSNHIEFRQEAWAIGKQVDKAYLNYTPLMHWLKESPWIHGNRKFQLLLWISPAITFATLLLVIINTDFYPFFILMTIIQTAIASFHAKRITQMQSKLGVYKSVLQNYSRLFSLMATQKFDVVILQYHQQKAKEGAEEVAKFFALVGALESRMNLITMMFGNGLFLYDLRSVRSLEIWREKNADSLPTWMESLAQWDALISFSTYHFNHPAFCFGEFTNNLSIESKGLGHPLISSHERITNDFALGKPANIMLVTGANMAGKSTFLRTLGINFILANNGAPVCAATWNGPLIELQSGMRTADSLQEHKSYFYAELYRLRSIIEQLNEGKQMLILLDEILKGTNSTDKQSGSRELIKQLMEKKALVLLATHDIALGDMEQQYLGNVSNACFEGQIENDQLTFDYKLHQGIAQKTNATFLMKKMGIIK